MSDRSKDVTEEAWIVEPMGGGTGELFSDEDSKKLESGWGDLMSALGDPGNYH